MSEVNDFSPVEFKPATEFDSAYNRINAYTSVPIDGISDQHRLETSVIGIADALQAAIQFRGKLTEYTHPSGVKKTTRKIDGKIPDTEDSLTVYVESDTILLLRTTKDRKIVYEVEFPPNDDFSNGDAEINADVSYMATEEFAGTDVVRDYAPAYRPSDPETQQGYARLLQRSLKDLVTVIEPPVSIPEDLTKQFGE